MLSIHDIKQAVTKIADSYPLKKVLLFGSYADNSANENSDVDLLVEFTSPAVSLLTLYGIKNDMEQELKKEVDIVHGPIEDKSMIQIKRTIHLYEQ